MYYVIFLLMLFLIFFYRKPSIKLLPYNEDVVYSPAHGTIMDIIYKNNTVHIAIFLSPFDIHYQIVPITGVLTDVKYDNTGKFELAYKVNKSNKNEKAIHTILNKHGIFKIYQIAGTLVRRIVWYNNPIKKIITGELLGLIKFGSRVDIIIPNANNFKINVKKGDKVKGINTVLGHF
jgi:phosphatidylserine decarboxylase|uniref:Phosphatidylserine decarboxylase n=1 Tax=viral metagenome TaxID=1070528 RepID=A0A6C0HE89_9ZZZZ